MDYLHWLWLYTALALPPALTPDLAYPQFGKNASIQPMVEQAKGDAKHLADMLHGFGASFDHDGQAWSKVPARAEPIRAAWIEAEAVRRIWDHVDWLTWPNATPEQRREHEAELKREIGGYFFSRGLLPLPLSMRTAPDEK